LLVLKNEKKCPLCLCTFCQSCFKEVIKNGHEECKILANLKENIELKNCHFSPGFVTVARVLALEKIGNGKRFQEFKTLQSHESELKGNSSVF